MPAKMDEIMEIANRYDIPVLEDAAEALGSTFGGQRCGTFDHFGALSFNGNKMITTSGGGGALVVGNEADKKSTMFYATQAREDFPYYQHKEIGYNYRMSNICAGIGRGQMEILEEHVNHHKHVHKLYEEAFKDIDGITLKGNPSAKHDSNFWLATILIDPKKTGFTYDELRIALDKKGIETRLLWKPLHLQPVFKHNPAYINGVSERLFSQGLCLPSGPYVSDKHIEFIISEIKNLLKR